MKKKKRYLYKVVNSSDRSVVLSLKDPYSIKYTNNEKISAPKDTFGIFLFKRFHQADAFAKIMTRCISEDVRIKRVIPCGRVHTLHFGLSTCFGLERSYNTVTTSAGSILKNRYKWIYSLSKYTLIAITTPSGTCVCQKVKVIETIAKYEYGERIL